MQRADDARPDPVAHAVRSRAPRHHRSSPGRRSSRSGARRAIGVPLHAGRPGPGPLGVAPRALSVSVCLAPALLVSGLVVSVLVASALGSTTAGRSTYFGAPAACGTSAVLDPSVALAGAVTFVVSPPPSDKLRSPA